MTRRQLLRPLILVFAFLQLFLAPAAGVQTASGERLIVRTSSLLDGLPVVRSACRILGCSVLYRIDAGIGKVFLVELPTSLTSTEGIALIKAIPGIADAEVDQPVRTSGAVPAGDVSALHDGEPWDYFGTTVRGGYIHQPATGIIGLSDAQGGTGLTGKGVTVAVIDTGVDPTHPVLAGVLRTGYDFTRNRDGGSERSDVNQSTMAVLDNAKPGWVNQSTMAILDQSTMAVLDDQRLAAFGHGTMVSGIIHLVAPRATILPLKAFRADGSGYSSDVLRAIYQAVNEDVDVINMSFSFQTNSRELARAIDHAAKYGIVAVAAAGNGGAVMDVYPAALPNVIGVASTTDWDTLSDFTNRGQTVAWMAAPGEGIVTTYPLGTWAAGWGTSYSAPLAAGTVALMKERSPGTDGKAAAAAVGAGVGVSDQVRTGRLHVPTALQARTGR